MRKNPQKPPLSLVWRGRPSNTRMPRPTARTTPNRSSDGWGTVAHRRHKVAIGYNDAWQIRLQKYPFPWTDRQIPLPASSLDRPTYDAKGHPDPIRRFSTMHWTVRRAHRRTDRQIVTPQESLTTIGAVLQERRGLIIQPEIVSK